MRFVFCDGEDVLFEDVCYCVCYYWLYLLYSQEMVWKQINCYVDMWFEVFWWWGFNLYVVLLFMIVFDFEGDQFMFFKFLYDELEWFYGIVVQEYLIYELFDQYIEMQVVCGYLMIVEVDVWFLFDMCGSSYCMQYMKMMIGIDVIDCEKQQIGYFYNSGYYVVEDFDYNGFVGGSLLMMLLLYVECVKWCFVLFDECVFCEVLLVVLQCYLWCLLVVDLIVVFCWQLQVDVFIFVEVLFEYFYVYLFNLVWQFGVNFELFGYYVCWLQVSGCIGLFVEICVVCDCIVLEVMVFEFWFVCVCVCGKEECGDLMFEVIEVVYIDFVVCVWQIGVLLWYVIFVCYDMVFVLVMW